MENEAGRGGVGVLVEVVDTIGIEAGGAAFQAVDFVAFFKKELSEVGAVLAGDAGDGLFFHRVGPSGVTHVQPLMKANKRRPGRACGEPWWMNKHQADSARLMR